MRMVIGRDQGQAPFGGEAVADLLAVFRVAVIENHLGAIAARGGDFDGGGVLRHDDHGLDAEQPRRQGDRLGMVARGIGDDAAGPLRVRELRQGIVAAAEFEGAHALQILRLEEQGRAGLGVGGDGGEDGCFMSDPGDALGGRGDVVEGDGERFGHDAARLAAKKNPAKARRPGGVTLLVLAGPQSEKRMRPRTTVSDALVGAG